MCYIYLQNNKLLPVGEILRLLEVAAIASDANIECLSEFGKKVRIIKSWLKRTVYEMDKII